MSIARHHPLRDGALTAAALAALAAIAFWQIFWVEGFFTPGVTRQQVLRIVLALALTAPLWFWRGEFGLRLARHLWAGVLLYAAMAATHFEIDNRGLAFDRARHFTFGAPGCEFLVDFPRRPAVGEARLALPDGPPVNAAEADLRLVTDRGDARLLAQCLPNPLEGDGIEELAYSLERLAMSYAFERGLAAEAVTATWNEEARLGEATLEGCINETGKQCDRLTMRILGGAGSLMILKVETTNWSGSLGAIERDFLTSARRRGPDVKP